MQDRKVIEETLNKIYRNAHIALQSISNVTEDTEDTEMLKELKEEYDGYEKIIGEISGYMKQLGLQPKDIGPIKKTMMWSSIKMKTMADNSRNHIADMMLQGTIMGIKELYSLLSEDEEKLDEQTVSLIKKLLEFEEGNEEKLKALL